MDINEKKQYVLYHGYIVCRNGDIISEKTGKKINAYNLTHKGSHIKLTIDGKKYVKHKAALIYECFNETPADLHNNVFQFLNGDETDASFDNIYLISKKEHLNNMRNKRKRGE